MSEAPEIYTIGDRTAELVFRSAGITDVSDLQKVLDQVEVALKQARDGALRDAARLMPRYFGVWSSTGVHIGIWEDGSIAAKVLGEYPGGTMRDLIDASAILALITRDADNG